MTPVAGATSVRWTLVTRSLSFPRPALRRPPRRIHRAVPHPSGDHDASGPLDFPYAFPRPGTYAIGVQIKRNGLVLRGAFVAAVDAPR